MDAADLLTLADELCRIAREAGRVIATSRPVRIDSKPSGSGLASQLVTDVDRRAEDCILEALVPEAARFGFAILTEERPDDKQRLAASHFFSIDPLDGTLPFALGTAGFAVSMALVSRAGVPVLGVVFDPLRDVLYRAVAGHGYRREPPMLPPSHRETLAVFADRSFVRERVVDGLEAIASERGLSGVEFHVGAGAVMNACGVLESPPACYFKLPKGEAGGGSLWDFAATSCLFGEAGLIATDMFGDPLDLNRPDSTFMNHRGVLYATDASLAAQIRARCQD